LSQENNLLANKEMPQTDAANDGPMGSLWKLGLIRLSHN
jgi:hypothetical protein